MVVGKAILPYQSTERIMSMSGTMRVVNWVIFLVEQWCLLLLSSGLPTLSIRMLERHATQALAASTAVIWVEKNSEAHNMHCICVVCIVINVQPL